MQDDHDVHTRRVRADGVHVAADVVDLQHGSRDLLAGLPTVRVQPPVLVHQVVRQSGRGALR